MTNFEKRAIAPVLLFIVAGASFTYGIWQYLATQRLQAAADQRVAHIVNAVESSGISRGQKDVVYRSVFQNWPAMPNGFGIEVSGLFASQQTDDACTSEGQRSVCRALINGGTSAAVKASVCGACDPYQ